MAKTIKRVGIIFFVLVVSLLVAIGSVFAVNVTVGSEFNENTNDIAIDSNGDSGNQYGIENADKADIPTAENEFILSGDCDAIAEEWKKAVSESLKYGSVVKATLMNDWIAKDDQYHSFGSGVGFSSYGYINIPKGANIILDLNGYKIDKHFTEVQTDLNLPVIYVADNFTLMDSGFDYDIVKDLFNQYKQDKDTLLAKLKALKCGKIMGGATVGNGGGINTPGSDNGNFEINIYGGMILDNIAASAGGGINIYTQVTLNLYNGAIINNISKGPGYYGGGGVKVGGTMNMYGGIIACNSSVAYGGGIMLEYGTLNIYDGIISHNTTGNDGGGVLIKGSVANYVTQTPAYFVMYGGIISYNRSSQYGGGIDFRTGGEGKMYGGEISHNWTFNDSGGVLVWTRCKFEMFGGKITENEAHGANTGNSNCGAGILIGDNSSVIMNGGEITYNHMYSDINRISTGGGIHVEGQSELVLNGGVIAGNTAESTLSADGGGVYNDAGSYIYIGGGVKIYNNTANGRESDLFLKKDVKLIIQKKLFTLNDLAHIGIDLASDYGETPFTMNYIGSGNLSAQVPLLFYSNVANKVPALSSNEVTIASGVKPTNYVTWSWQGDSSGSVNNKMTDISVTFTGNPYTIKMQNNSFYKIGTGTAATSFEVIDAGSYSFYTTDSIVNSVFTFTILPKEVDVLWKNTDLVYNGGSQKPTAYIADDPNCKVTVTGEKINSGVGYIATATGLSNKNYKIKNTTSSVVYNIAKAKVDRPFGSGTFEFNGSEKVFTPNGYNFVTMNITGNKATNVGSYEATISLKDKLNYEWADGGNEDIKLQYAITLAPVVEEDNSVYKFIYLDTEDNTRKTYTEGDLKHGLNDSNVNIKDGNAHYVLGNIMPETSVKDFVQTLNYDSTKLKVFNNKGVEVALTDEVTVVGSGWYIEYTPVAGGAKDTIYLSVLGDVTGDGRIDATDITYLRRIANGEIDKEVLNPAVLLAAMVDNRGKITSVDAEILRAICKYETVINKYF